MGFINVKWKGASLKQDASNRLVTDNEKTTWNNKANNSHTHTKSDIKDFPSSLPASDVYSWAKASSKPSYSKSEVGLGNVDNTADSVKNVAMATKLQTYKSDSSGTYGADYPLFAQWDSNGKTVNMVCKGYTVRVQSAATADSADRSNYLSGHGCKPSDSHPGHGAEIFYSWDIGQVENESKGFSVGITIGANPGDSAYGFQIVQNLWDDRTYTRRYNNGEWQKWRMLAWLSDIPTSLPASDVSDWAKAATKPSYTWTEIDSKPSTFTPSSHTHNYAGSDSAGGSANTAIKLLNARSIFGQSFDGSANIEGKGIFFGSYTETAKERFLNCGIEIRENGLVGLTQTDQAYAPSLGFNWNNEHGGKIIIK